MFNLGFDLSSVYMVIRSDIRLPQSHAGGQGPYLRSLDHLGRSSEAKDREHLKEIKCDTPTDGWTDRQQMIGQTNKTGIKPSAYEIEGKCEETIS